VHYYPQNPLHSCQLVADLLATNGCNGIWETTRHNRHNGLLPAPTCYRLVADLLQGSRQLVTDLLRGNWCNGFWPLRAIRFRRRSPVHNSLLQINDDDDDDDDDDEYRTTWDCGM